MGIFSNFLTNAANKAAQATNWLSKAGAIPAKGIGAATGKAVSFILGNPIASRIVGLGLTIKGGVDLGKYLAGDENDRDKSGKYSGILNILLGGSLVLFNDKQWYLDEDMSNVAGVPSWITKRSDYNVADLSIPLQNCVVLDYDHCLPLDVDNTINQNIDSIFRNLRSAARYNGTYTNEQVKRYVTNVCALTTAYSAMVRLYGLLNAYNSYDTTTPRTYLYGLGLDDTEIDDLVNHLADFRYFLLNISKSIIKVAQIAPMFALERASYYASMAFLDAPHDKAVPIFLNPRRIEIYNSSDGEYQMYNLKENMVSIDTMRQTLALLINELGSGVNSVIASDMVTAYGTSAYLGLVVPEEDYIPAFLFDSEITTEIHNASFWAYNSIDAATGVVYPDSTGAIVTDEYGIDQLNGLEGLRLTDPAKAYYYVSPSDSEIIEIAPIQVSVNSPKYIINGDPNDLSSMGTLVATRFVSVTDYEVLVDQDSLGSNSIAFSPRDNNSHSGIILTHMTFVCGKDDILELEGYGNVLFHRQDPGIEMIEPTANLKQKILSRWEQVSFLPRVMFLYNTYFNYPVKINTLLTGYQLIYSSIEDANESIAGAKLFSFYDYDIFAVYDSTLKLPYDTIANSTLYSTNIVLKQVATMSAKVGITGKGTSKSKEAKNNNENKSNSNNSHSTKNNNKKKNKKKNEKRQEN